MIVNALIHSAQQGFPDLRGHVNTVIQEKLGDPSFHVGENWVDWWLERWGKWLSTYWSTSLDMVRARALNPTITEDYLQKVGELSQHMRLILTACGQWMKPALLLGAHARPGSLDRQGTVSSSLREMVIRKLQPSCLLSLLLLEHACHPVSSSNDRHSPQSGQHQRTTHLNAHMS